MTDQPIIANSRSPYCRLRSVGLNEVRWTDGFWADRFRQCVEVTLPHLWKLAADPEWGHALTNLRIAAGLEKGEFAGTDWQDAWIYKWLEAASVVWGVTADNALDKLMDETIDVIARAQQPDGYIASQITVPGRERFQALRHHELYVMGHLITAACIHHRMTGKTSLLEVARKTADYVYEMFRGRDPALAHFPQNPSIIMASVELYRTTGERKYLDMANLFIDMRGAVAGGSDLNQDSVPLREETQVVGHAVFFTYLFAGAADAYMETGDHTLLDALERLWHDLTERRMYLTGGVCALHRGLAVRGGRDWTAHDVHEAAGDDYFLPNATAYNETCGQVGSFMWNWRMLAITGDARCADLMERQLYNSIISGIGLDGASWFYTNPLRWHGKEHVLHTQDAYQRFEPGTPPRRSHICCPTNVLRTTAELHGYLYSTSEEGLWVHHYGGSTFDGRLTDGRALRATQQTDYPWDGVVKLRMDSAPDGPLGVMMRIPQWAERAKLTVNGQCGRTEAKPGSYGRVHRTWTDGDEIELVLPMPVRLIEAHPRAEQLCSQVAVMRGPLVYCLESVDLPDGVALSEVHIPRDIRLVPRHDRELLGGVTVLEGEALRVPAGEWSGKLYREMGGERGETVPIRLIPYYAWCNRGVGQMTVWMPTA